MKTGDSVTITFEGRKVEGSIKLASPNQKSLMLEFEAILGGYAGMMPVSLGDDGVYRDLLTNQEVKVELEN